MTTGRQRLVYQNLRDTGTLYNTLIKACEITGEVRAVRPATAEHGKKQPCPPTTLCNTAASTSCKNT